MSSLKIKVCGMKIPENMEAVSGLKPDFMGFIFYPPSKRFIGLDFEVNHLKAIDKNIIKTGVFVNATINEVVEFGKLYGMQAIQLHGSESPEFCQQVKAQGFFTIKAFGVDDTFDFTELNQYQAHVDLFLFDTKSDQYGGSGVTFNWQILEKYKLDTPFMLSGGISLDNLDEVLTLKHPQFYGVDINSKFEIEPGLKDIEKLKKAFEKLKR
ncbi:MAG TPA: phosphoribosylanthranilate isomerase [Pelobium sp.]|nr:phosphoribosylanthranilate isomerase [Pelobium sp.]